MLPIGIAGDTGMANCTGTPTPVAPMSRLNAPAKVMPSGKARRGRLASVAGVMLTGVAGGAQVAGGNRDD